VLGITRFGISKMKESALMQASVSCSVADVKRGIGIKVHSPVIYTSITTCLPLKRYQFGVIHDIVVLNGIR